MICVRLLLFVILLLIDLGVTPRGFAQSSSNGNDDAVPPVAMKVEAIEHLPNVFRLPGEILSGGLPADEHAFQELADLGVKTVISVDGAPPNLELAQRFGLRYVHLPIGYDGIPASRIPELAKAVHELPRPLYFHCHHGKHRSPAAAVVACIANGLLDAEAADVILKRMGTAPHYIGLYESANLAKRIDPQQLADLQVSFAAVVDPPPLIHAMLEIEHLHDQLAIWSEKDWKTDQRDSSTSAAHLALLLKEQFVEMQRLTESKKHDPAFSEMLKASIRNSDALESSLRAASSESDDAGAAGTAAGGISAPHRRIGAAWQRVNRDCQTCHRRFRDTPR